MKLIAQSWITDKTIFEVKHLMAVHGSIVKVLGMQMQGPDFNPQTLIKI